MKNLFLSSLILSTSLAAFAQTKYLPEVQAPRELVSGIYSEGTVTRLNQTDIAGFVPWAQNAQNILTKVLKDSKTLSISRRLPKIENAIRSVVQNSGSKNYQMFMRFALNRGLLLSEELNREARSRSKLGTALAISLNCSKVTFRGIAPCCFACTK